MIIFAFWLFGLLVWLLFSAEVYMNLQGEPSGKSLPAVTSNYSQGYLKSGGWDLAAVNFQPCRGRSTRNL